MATLGIANDKVPAGVVGAYRSDGETIPWYDASGGNAVGDVLTRAAGHQALAVVSSLDATDMTAGGSTDAVSSAGSTIQVRIYGMFFLPIADGTYSDGDLVSWGGTNMAANATGAHEIVGDYVSGDTHACVRINIVPGTAT
jgi:hypothetical protein